MRNESTSKDRTMRDRSTTDLHIVLVKKWKTDPSFSIPMKIDFISVVRRKKETKENIPFLSKSASQIHHSAYQSK